MKRIFIFIFSLAVVVGCASKSSNIATSGKSRLPQASPLPPPKESKETKVVSCASDTETHRLRSDELQGLMREDQADRENFQNKAPAEMLQMSKKDEARRKRVLEIEKEGCLLKVEDFAAAALIYQHGDKPEHFNRAYSYAKKAVEMGDINQKNLMALSLDRYLVATGHRQLFGSQAYRPSGSSCWCMQQYEKKFSESIRENYTGKTMSQQIAWVKGLNSGLKCKNIECPKDLKPNEKGSIPGFW